MINCFFPIFVKFRKSAIIFDAFKKDYGLLTRQSHYQKVQAIK